MFPLPMLLNVSSSLMYVSTGRNKQLSVTDAQQTRHRIETSISGAFTRSRMWRTDARLLRAESHFPRDTDCGGGFREEYWLYKPLRHLS